MKELENLLSNIKKVDFNSILFKVWKDKKNQEYIIELNTKGKPTSQLYELGEDSLGRAVGGGNYAPSTVEYKFNEGQRFDHITLNDTGEFYRSFRVKPNKKGFTITANPNKDDTNLFTEYGDEIVGLNKENTELLLKKIEPEFNKLLSESLFR